MRVKILNKEHFSVRSNQNLSTLDNAENVHITLPRRKLVFSIKGVDIAKYEAEHNISFEEYEDRIICYLKDNNVKRISFEIFGNSDQLNEIKKTLVRRNTIINYKPPLQNDYSIKIQESMLFDKNRELNIQGFINLALIFICLNYVILITEAKTEKRLLFMENVS